MHPLKTALIAHHKKTVGQFHKKHSDILKKAKKHMLHVATATLMTTAAGMHGYAHQLDQDKLAHKQQLVQENRSLASFLAELSSLLAKKPALTLGEENVIAQALSKRFGINLKTSLEGNKLNEIVGYMDAEQHLYRWAGDNLAKHDLQQSGIAPLQGAFKNFDNEEQEKYYVAVQLHELPNWNAEWSTLKPWYRYRKVFVYNPVNQKGVVAVIGDAGPSKWTGKTFGGSPEVMNHLEMVDGARKGKAIILFIDDPENKIALGPASAEDIKTLASR